MPRYLVRDRVGRALGEIRAPDLTTAKARADAKFVDRVGITPGGLQLEVNEAEET